MNDEQASERKDVAHGLQAVPDAPAEETEGASAPANDESDTEENFPRDYVKSLREENKRRRIEARELAQKVESLSTRAKGLLLKAAFQDEAVRAGIAHPEDAFKLADLSGVEVDTEEESVKGIADAVESLRIDRPYLFRRDKPRPYGPEASLAGSAPSPLEAARDAAMKNPSIKNVARYQTELARAKHKT